jgi:hypothetical protein
MEKIKEIVDLNQGQSQDQDLSLSQKLINNNNNNNNNKRIRITNNLMHIHKKGFQLKELTIKYKMIFKSHQDKNRTI